jgi:acetate kinase
MDDQKNAGSSGRLSEIQVDGSPLKILVIPTDEELEIARQTVQRIQTEPVESCREPSSGLHGPEEMGK